MTKISIQKANYSEVEIGKLLSPLGGMASFVEKGDKVLLKVNLLSAREPEHAVTTDPEVVREVARAVKQAGGRPYIGDSPSGRFSKRALRRAYRRSGLEDVAIEEGIPLNWDTQSRRLIFPEGVRLKHSSMCNFVLKADKIIALPKLKTHSFQFLTLACKIMYGAIPGLTKARYHAQFPKRSAFADMMLDVTMHLNPGLYIMDGILGMQGQGPGSGDPVNLGWLLASTDPVAMDIAVCRLIGIEPIAIPVLKRAKVRKLWPEDIEYPIRAPEEIAYHGFKLPNTAGKLLTGKKVPTRRPTVTDKCIACGDCEEICPRGAIQIENEHAFVDDSKCIRCFCCHEVCPEKAIDLVEARFR
jgi:uncharacterized protein (DUF362 family)/NAD-dependent dihydropyrimidine dehydrogenase PreA subunit